MKIKKTMSYPKELLETAELAAKAEMKDINEYILEAVRKDLRDKGYLSKGL